MSKRTTKKRRKCVTAWFALDNCGNPDPYTGTDSELAYRSNHFCEKRAEYRLVPVRKAKR